MPRREVAWSLLRELAPGARVTNACAFCGAPHGAVRLHGVAAVASVTYAGGFAIVTVADADVVAAIGVDAEVAGRSERRVAGSSPTVEGGEVSLARVLGEGASLREWVRVEAVLKADGRGLRVDPALVGIRTADDGWSATLPDRTGSFAGIDVDGPPGVLVSVAVRARAAEAPGDRSTR